MWAAPSVEQAQCAVSLVRDHLMDAVLVSSLCGGQVPTHSLLLALHSPLLARLLAEAGPGTQALTIPFNLQVISGLVHMMQGGDNEDEGQEVGEAADFLSMFSDKSNVGKNNEVKQKFNDIKIEVLSGNISSDGLKLKTKERTDIKEVKKGPETYKYDVRNDDISKIKYNFNKKEMHTDTSNGKDDVSDKDQNYGEHSYLENIRVEGAHKKSVKKFKSGSRLIKMIKKEFHCNHCSFSLKTQVGLNRHMNRKHGILITCLKCNEEFEDNVVYKMHMKTNHISYGCKICHLPMNSGSALYAHMQSHQEAMPCSYCGKAYSSRNSLNCHVIRTHGEEYFNCSKCDYKCKASAGMNWHFKRRHTEQTQATCESCGGVFKNLKHHLQRNSCGAMGQVDRVKVPCELKCGKTFFSNNKMLNHVKYIHYNIKDKVCSQCPYATYSNFNLKLHITKMHLGKELVKKLCPYCEKETTNLNHHIQMYHSETKLENKSLKV